MQTRKFSFTSLLAISLAFGFACGAAAQQSNPSREQAASRADFVDLAKKAYTLHRQGKNAEAIVAAEDAEREGASNPPLAPIQLAQGWNVLGMTLFEFGDNEGAKRAYDKGLAMVDAASAAGSPLQADLLNNLGQAEGRLGHGQHARQALEAALDLRQRFADSPRALASAMDNLATVYRQLQDLDKAEELHLKALAIFEGDAGTVSDDAATANGNLGALFRSKRDPVRAEAYLLRALDAHDRLFGIEHQSTVIDLVNLAEFYLEVDDEVRSDRLVNLLIGIGGSTPGKQHRHVANAIYFLAEQAQSRWQLGLAERLAARAVDIYRIVLAPGDVNMFKSVFLLASIQSAKSDFSSAERNYRWLLDAYAAGGTPRQRAAVMVQLAKVYRQWRSFPVAAEILKEAVDLLRSDPTTSAEDKASALGNLAQVYCEAENPTAAEQKYDEAIAAVENEKHSSQHPWLLHGRALLWYHLGRYEQAQRGLQQARDIWAETLSKEHPFVATVTANLALVSWARNDVQKTVELLSQVSQLRERELRRTLTVGSERQRLDYAKGLQFDLWEALSFCFAASGCTGDSARLAAELLLQRKGRVLDAVVETTRESAQQLSAEDHKLVYRLDAVRRSISGRIYPALLSGEAPTETHDLTLLLQEESDLQRSLSYKSAAIRASLEPVTVQAVQRSLPTRSTLVEFVRYFVFEPIRAGHGEPWRGERYAALVLTGEQEPRWFDLGPADKIEAAVQAFRLRLRNRSAIYSTIDAERLFDLLIAPFEGILSNSTHTGKPFLLIAPDGPLNVVPFGLMREPGGPAIGDRFVVDYLGSGRELLQQRSPASSKQIVVFANPDFDAEVGDASSKMTMQPAAQGRFTPLPGTMDEAARLERLLPSVSSFTGKRATVAALAAVDRPAVLHVATHGIFIRADRPEPQVSSTLLSIAGSPSILRLSMPSRLDNPLLFSGLAMAGANQSTAGGNPGVISALEISGLRLQGTQLVVLSACETGLGSTKQGEEFSGLRRAIFIAGAASQVTSLWKVDDAATSALMVHYYSLLLKGQGRAEALQLAQQRLMRENPKWRHPFFWAGFIASGDWKPIDGLAPRSGNRVRSSSREGN